MQIPPSIIIVVPNVENNLIIAKKASKASMDSRIFPVFFVFLRAALCCRIFPQKTETHTLRHLPPLCYTKILYWVHRTIRYGRGGQRRHGRTDPGKQHTGPAHPCGGLQGDAEPRRHSLRQRRSHGRRPLLRRRTGVRGRGGASLPAVPPVPQGAGGHPPPTW